VWVQVRSASWASEAKWPAVCVCVSRCKRRVPCARKVDDRLGVHTSWVRTHSGVAFSMVTCLPRLLLLRSRLAYGPRPHGRGTTGGSKSLGRIATGLVYHYSLLHSADTPTDIVYPVGGRDRVEERCGSSPRSAALSGFCP